MDSEDKPADSEMVSELPEPEVEPEDVKKGMLRAAPTRNRFGKTSKAKKHEQTSKEASEENCDEKKIKSEKAAIIYHADFENKQIYVISQ